MAGTKIGFIFLKTVIRKNFTQKIFRRLNAFHGNCTLRAGFGTAAAAHAVFLHHKVTFVFCGLVIAYIDGVKHTAFIPAKTAVDTLLRIDHSSETGFSIILPRLKGGFELHSILQKYAGICCTGAHYAADLIELVRVLVDVTNRVFLAGCLNVIESLFPRDDRADFAGFCGVGNKVEAQTDIRVGRNLRITDAAGTLILRDLAPRAKNLFDIFRRQQIWIIFHGIITWNDACLTHLTVCFHTCSDTGIDFADFVFYHKGHDLIIAIAVAFIPTAAVLQIDPHAAGRCGVRTVPGALNLTTEEAFGQFCVGGFPTHAKLTRKSFGATIFSTFRRPVGVWKGKHKSCAFRCHLAGKKPWHIFRIFHSGVYFFCQFPKNRVNFLVQNGIDLCKQFRRQSSLFTH